MGLLDKNVVQMVFDNKQFEQNVAQSRQSIDNLKKSLDFEKSASSLSSIDKAVHRIDLSAISNSVESIQDKFSMLGILGVTAMQKIADKAIDTGVRIAKALSIDNIGAGEKKYEMQIKAAQTIISATGKPLEEVEKVLETLMTYTDETSYDFATMVDSIGKFTSVGVELNVAEKAMEGIANEAARSGAGIQEANRAMYNFAQALSQGSVKLIDWKSIANANMATKEFKEELIKTAIAEGTLKKGGEKIGYIMKQTKKATKKTAAEFKKTEVDYKSFESTLSEGWLTSDVLIKTLNRYADTATEIGKVSFAAAKEYRTFGDVMDTIRDSVSSGWMKTFKLLFGDLNEAKDLWTRVGDSILSFTSIFTDARNELLEGWHELGGYNTAIEAASNLWHTFMNVVELVKDTLADAFPPTTADRLNELTEQFRDFTEAVRDFFSIGTPDKVIDKEIEKTIDYSKELGKEINANSPNYEIANLQKRLKNAGYLRDLESPGGAWGPKTENAIKRLQHDLGVDLTGAWDEATRSAVKAKGVFIETEVEIHKYVAKNKKEVEKWVEERYNDVDKVNFYARRYDTGKDIKRLQDFLVKYKYLDKAQADGVYGPETEEAVKKLQEVLGVEITGRWDKATRDAAAASKRFSGTKLIKKTVLEDAGGISKFMETFQHALNGLFYVIKIGKDIAATAKDILKEFFKSFEPLTKPFRRIVEILRYMLQDLELKLRKRTLPNFAKKAKKSLEPFSKVIENVASAINKFIDGYLKFVTGTAKVGKKSGAYKTVKTAFVSFESLFKYIKIQIKKTPVGKFLFDLWDKISNFGSNVKTFLSTTLQSVIDFFKNLMKPMKDKDGNPIGFIDRLKEAFKSFEGVGDWIKEKLGGLFGPKDAGAATESFNLLEEVGKTVQKVIDFIKTIDVAQLALFATALYGAYKIYKRIKAPMDMMTSIAEIPKQIAKNLKRNNVTKTLEGVGEFAKNMGIAVALLAASVYAIAQLDPGKALISVGIIALLMAEIGGFAFVMNKLKLDGVGTKGMIKFTAAILILANAVVKLASIPFDRMMGALLGLTIIMGEMIAYSKLMKNEKFQVGGMIDLGTGISMMVNSVKILSEIDTDKMIKGLIGLGAVMVELGVFMKLVNGAEFKAKIGGMIGIGAAVLMLAASLKIISKMSWGEILKGLVGLGAVFLELGLFMRLTSGFGSSKGLLGMIGIGVAVLLVSKSMEGIAKLDTKGIIKGIIGLGAIFLELAIFMKLIAGRNPVRMIANALGLVGIGVALGLVVASFRSLAKMKTKGIIKGIIGLGAIFLELAIFMKLIGARNPVHMLANSVALIGIGAALNLFVLAIAGLSMINTGGLVKGIIAIGALFLEIAAFLKIIGGTQASLKALPVLIVVASSLLIFALALLAVSKIPWTTIAAFGVSFGVALSALSKSMMLLGTMPISGALTAIANLDLFIANLVLVLGAFAGLQKLTGGEFGRWMQTGAEVIGQAIGGFINGIMTGIKGDKTGAGRSKPKSLADYIKEFIKDIESIIPSLKRLGKSANGIKEDGLKTIASAMGWFVAMAGEILAIDILTLLSNIANFLIINEDNGIAKFIEDIDLLMPEIVKLSNSKKKVNVDTLKNISDGIGHFVAMAAKILAIDFISLLTNIADFISFSRTGKGGIANFIDRLYELLPSLEKLSGYKKKINTSTLENIASGFKALASMAISMLKIELIEVLSNIDKFLGVADPIKSFIGKLETIIPPLIELSMYEGGVNVKVLRNIASGMDALSAMATASLKVSWQEWLSNITSLLGGGDKNVVDFIDMMVQIAPKLKQLGNNTGEVKIKNIKNAAGALGALADVANKIPPTNGILQDIVGEKNIGTFGDRLEALGKGIASFSKETKDIPNDYDPKGPLAALTALSNLESGLEEHGGLAQWFTGEKDLGVFGEEIAKLGDNLTKFFDSTKTVDGSKIEALGAGLESLATAAAMTPSTSTLYDSVSGLQYLVDSLSDPSVFDYSGVAASGEQIANSIKVGFSNGEGDILTETEVLCEAIIAVVEGLEPKFKSVGKYIDDGIIKGIKENETYITGAAKQVAWNAYIAAKEKLGIQSPSKKGEELGMYFDLGLANGLKSYSDKIGQASSDSANGAVDSAKLALNNLDSVLSNDMDTQPVIRPVLDASMFKRDVQSEMSGAFGDASVNPSIRLTESSKRVESISTQIQNDMTKLYDSMTKRDEDLVTTFNNLNDRLDTLNNDIKNLKLYLDGDILVGGILPKVDSGLGKRQVMARRMN